MGKAFRRLEKQVEGRRALRTRYVPFPARIRALEMLALELGAYLALHVANNPEDSSDSALVEAYEEFKKLLEGTV